MARSYFHIKALTTAALVFFAFSMIHFATKAIDFVWSVKVVTREDSDSECQDSDFEDLDTEEFPLPEKCASPPPYEPSPPPYENN